MKDKNCNNNLNLILTYGQIEKLPERMRFNNNTSSRYYKANLTSSGVELRINGRAWKTLRMLLLKKRN